MHVIRAESEKFQSSWKLLWNRTSIRYPLYGDCNLNYYQTYNSDKKFTDNSFVIEDEDGPIAGMCVTNFIDRSGKTNFSAFGLPTLYVDNIYNNSSSKSWKLVKKEIQSLIENTKSWHWQHNEILHHSNISPVGRFFLSHGGQANIKWTQRIYLKHEEDDIFRGCTKGCRHAINWGKKNINLHLLDSSNILQSDIHKFRDLHIEVAGRESRNIQSWESQYQMVMGGEAFLVFGFMDDILVTAALFSFSVDYCFYGVSASKRELFGKPISHALIWKAILHAQNLGCEWFDMAGQSFKADIPFPSDKELSISSFKSGFGGKTSMLLNIETNSGNIYSV